MKKPFPFLSLTVVDALSWLMLKRVEGNISEPFRVRFNEVALSHLQFAIITMLFWSGNEASFLNLMILVGLFEMMFGLKINTSKCQVLGINCDQGKLNRWATVVGCDVSSLSTPWSSLRDPVSEKIRKRLASGKKDGWLTLIRSMLSGILVYYFSLFKAPSFVCKSIKKLMRIFLWERMNRGKGSHLVSWQRIIVSKYGITPFEWVAKGVKGTHRTPRRISRLSPLISLLRFRCIVGDGKEPFSFVRSVGWG